MWRTQIKRAYEMSVCIAGSSVQNPDYRVGGCAWRNGVSIDGDVSAKPEVSVRRVLFSFHIVEIS
ncbi:hypothetical protein DNK59_09835 [Pseudomonas sp. TKO26]|uniref:Uncharacterized protein n=1 Tax=Pseudomonas saponiphila TaxID=556534 RepID=A0A1H4REH9_9PSED|nr:hypothetical protein DNK62_09835 [Pseudomonas sp. TKO30]PYY90944.1 hypothetical protein DNK61_09835 [Pseudomonas sp. TKO29]PYY93817.1 hypothetical protein DNK59_09835 [Pseudomonas sp. TKO26]PYZ00547.1 hypothetical protein DNK60_09835 [Pseudomonas sp. TKO14]SEC30239.1 hypothetical protein SAMN05216178_4160 [Pseudomonas saponiphila]